MTVYSRAKISTPTNDTATLTHTVRGGDYTGVAASTVSVTVEDNDDIRRGVTVAPNLAQHRCRRERDVFHRR